jgi:hypothetical protein
VVADWLSFNYERSDYWVNLHTVHTFRLAEDGRMTFWLRDSGIPIVLQAPLQPQAYARVQAHCQQLSGAIATQPPPPTVHWLTMAYDRAHYWVDLGAVSAYSRAENGRITFWLPDNGQPIILHPKQDQPAYDDVVAYLVQRVDPSFQS